MERILAQRSKTARKRLRVCWLASRLWAPAAAFLVASLLLAAGLVASSALDRAIGDFTKDPTAVLGGPFYVGFLSNLGVLAIWTGAVACLVSAAALRRVDENSAAALSAGGAILAVLALDDLFQLHEYVLPEILGVPQHRVVAIYGLAAVTYGIAYRRFLRDTDWPLLLVAAGFLGLSAIVDRLGDVSGAHHHLLEDGLKLFGVILCSAYFISVSAERLHAALRRPDARGG